MRIDFDNANTFAGYRMRREPAAHLLDAICELASAQADLVGHHQSAWASITFSGTRHRVSLCFDGAEAVASGEAFVAALPDHEFAIPGQIVADAGIVAVDHRLLPHPLLTVDAELLLLDDA